MDTKSKLEWEETTIEVGDANLLVQQAGSGAPLLILHEELGCPGTVGWQEQLAVNRTLVVPHHPGFGRTSRVPWLSNVRDLAALYGWFLREQKMTPIDVIGFSFGGWIAAEMAASDPSLFSQMVLVGAHGIRPPEGEILDLFMITADAYLRRSVLDPVKTPEFANLYGAEQTPEQYEAFEEARAETARLAWKPYMFNPSLPYLLEAAGTIPTLLIWGEQDSIVPPSAGEAYRGALPNSKFVVVEKSGHRPEIENPKVFLDEVKGFFN